MKYALFAWNRHAAKGGWRDMHSLHESAVGAIAQAEEVLAEGINSFGDDSVDCVQVIFLDKAESVFLRMT